MRYPINTFSSITRVLLVLAKPLGMKKIVIRPFTAKGSSRSRVFYVYMEDGSGMRLYETYILGNGERLFGVDIFSDSAELMSNKNDMVKKAEHNLKAYVDVDNEPTTGVHGLDTHCLLEYLDARASSVHAPASPLSAVHIVGKVIDNIENSVESVDIDNNEVTVSFTDEHTLCISQGYVDTDQPTVLLYDVQEYSSREWSKGEKKTLTAHDLSTLTYKTANNATMLNYSSGF